MENFEETEPSLHVLEILREIEQKQIVDLDPVKVDVPAMELLRGGLLETKVYSGEMGKKKIVLYLTERGRNYLQKFG